jgi:hypothetical protein
VESINYNCRGALVTVNVLCITTGQFLSYLCNSAFTYLHEGISFILILVLTHSFMLMVYVHFLFRVALDVGCCCNSCNHSIDWWAKHSLFFQLTTLFTVEVFSRIYICICMWLITTTWFPHYLSLPTTHKAHNHDWVWLNIFNMKSINNVHIH